MKLQFFISISRTFLFCSSKAARIKYFLRGDQIVARTTDYSILKSLLQRNERALKSEFAYWQHENSEEDETLFMSTKDILKSLFFHVVWKSSEKTHFEIEKKNYENKKMKFFIKKTKFSANSQQSSADSQQILSKP